ncbi:Gfo/Idh/MocA family oxidoreductase [Parenemella sanctibonifatiensis]|uniref:Gfo/Idh/MocA-like oxidoreductase N-terminal domain-containing protein n=1 Tax=Parenemella sanctibonifatiensis TaxID=2016505 RepID=A0A255ERA0_9ACTN|nr:Gfo/Idh/MocA family oxidoreductase [Parenemella sanctibonifatiensis]OYN91982.1 hypothetical protein CGZ91_00145 [Parenemella sanctibonifatiensis]
MRIAYIDHHLRQYHSKVFTQAFRDLIPDLELVAYESDPSEGEDWCQEFGVQRAESVAEALEAADGVVVMAPDNIEAHPALLEQVLPAGLPTVVDKLLAPSIAEGNRLLDLAQQHNTPMVAASGLSHAEEFDAVDLDPTAVEAAWVRGYGKWDHYGIHSVAVLLRMVGTQVRRVRNIGREGAALVAVDLGERWGSLDCRVGAERQWSGGFKAVGAEEYTKVDVVNPGGFYTNMVSWFTDFLRGEAPAHDRADLMAPVAIIEGAQLSAAQDGAWVDLDLA